MTKAYRPNLAALPRDLRDQLAADPGRALAVQVCNEVVRAHMEGQIIASPASPAPSCVRTLSTITASS